MDITIIVSGEVCTDNGGGAYSFVACLSRMTIDHAPLARRRTVPTPKGLTIIDRLISSRTGTRCFAFWPTSREL